MLPSDPCYHVFSSSSSSYSTSSPHLSSSSSHSLWLQLIPEQQLQQQLYSIPASRNKHPPQPNWPSPTPNLHLPTLNHHSRTPNPPAPSLPLCLPLPRCIQRPALVTGRQLPRPSPPSAGLPSHSCLQDFHPISSSYYTRPPCDTPSFSTPPHTPASSYHCLPPPLPPCR